jgi:holo-[acyl-carrier protein] synthase
MDAGTQLRRTVAGFFDVDEGQVGSSFSLASCDGSIARAAFDAAIRRGVGVKSDAVYSARTFGELAAGLGIGGLGIDGSPAPPPAPATVASPPSTAGAPVAGASCGVDLELVANLPSVGDPWEDPFYRAHFSPSEIAYCLRQAEPPLHFAARWCVKEALKKCDRAFLAVEGKDVEVVHDEAGAPYLVHLIPGSPSRLPHAVSLSHTPHAAVAVVVRVEAAPSPSMAVVTASSAPPNRSRSPPCR